MHSRTRRNIKAEAKIEVKKKKFLNLSLSLSLSIMNLSSIGEQSLIGYIKDKCNIKDEDVLIGIGDDAALLKIHNNNLLVTTDVMNEGIHFDLTYTTPFQIGFKLVSINVSDIYAMLGDPKFILLSLSFPPFTEEMIVREFLDGVYRGLKVYDIRLVGGDISSSKHISVSATVLGSGESPVTRQEAKVGDRIYVTGTLGDSACGLLLLKKIKKRIYMEKGEVLEGHYEWEIVKPVLQRHLMPFVQKPVFSKEQIHSMMDISDGLFIDLKKLCKESGVGARVYGESLPLSEEFRIATSYLDENPLLLSACGGEDYQYLFTSNVDIKDATCIGEIIRDGFKLIDREKRIKEWIECGYDHFRD